MFNSALPIAAALILLTVMFYSRRWLLSEIPEGRRRLMTLLRITFLLALLLLAFKPTVRQRETVRVPDKVLFLLDDSASMELASGDGISRAEKVKTDLLRTIVRRLVVAGWQVQARTFAGQTVTSANYQPDGASTAIGDALRQVERLREDGEKIVLVGDGCSNAGEDPLVVAESLNFPVWTLGVGSREAPPDVSVTSLTAPEQAFQDEEVDIRVGVRGMEEIVDVVLRADGHAIQSATAALENGVGKVEFDVKFHSVGAVSLRAEILPLDNEIVTANNSLTRSLKVSKSRTGGVVVWGKPDWESHFIVNALREDRRLLVDAFWAFGKSKTLHLSPERDADERPRTRTVSQSVGQLLRQRIDSGIDWMVLGNVDLLVLGEDAVAEIVTWVSESGGSLYCVGGPNSFSSGGYAESNLARLLPVQLKDEPDFVPRQRRMNLTSAGRMQLLMASAAGAEGLPPLDNGNVFENSKPGARILFSSGDDDEPVMAVHRFGLGNVMAFGGYGTWQWQMYDRGRAPEGAADHGRFWRSVVSYFDAAESSSELIVQTDRNIYEQGDSAELWVYFPVREASPQKEVGVQVIDPDGEVDDMRLLLRADEANLYTGTYAFRKPGGYAFSLSVGAKTTERKVNVQAPRKEYDVLNQNVDLLSAIAEKTGGKYLPEDEWDTLAKNLPREKKIREQDRWVSWGRKPWVILLLLSFLTAEWLLRRRSGLP